MKVLSLVTLAIAVGSVLALLDPDSGLSIWLELRRDLETSDARVERLVRENEALRGEIAILENEPAALDRVIREELDLVLPGEVMVRFEPSPPGEASGKRDGSAAESDRGAREAGESL